MPDQCLSFSTAGLRAKMDAGCAYMNLYTVAHASAGLAKLICSCGKDAMSRGVAIAHDSRNQSRAFAERTAQVLSSFGIKSYLFDSLRPTPVLSFALRELSCIAGVNITASHNPREYNGYKVYWEDGAQLSPEYADAVADEMARLDILRDVPPPSAADSSLMLPMPPEIDEKYIDRVLCESVNPNVFLKPNKLSVVYTLHGAGISWSPLFFGKREKNLHIVTQQTPDGNFPPSVIPTPISRVRGGIKLANELSAADYRNRPRPTG